MAAVEGGVSPDQPAPTVASPVARLVGVEPVGDDVFEATIPRHSVLPRLFGGQVAAQALLAGSRTVPPRRPPHSLHAYFVRAGQPNVPVRYEVERIRDGRSFSTRRVTARQDQSIIFELLASFQRPEPGARWQMPPPTFGDIPAPPTGPVDEQIGLMIGHFDIRRVDPSADAGWRIHPFWFRSRQEIGDDPTLNSAMLTYVSDIAMVASARPPGANEPLAAAASLDHAIWFHRPPRVDEWLLYSIETVANIGARGTVRGTFHTADGALVASVTQEALVRLARID